MTVGQMKEMLRGTLNPKRYIHSLGVCDTAVRLARLYGADEEKAYLAGLLHDCAKCYDGEGQRAVCEKYGVHLTEDDILCPPVIHAPLGAAVARAEYGIEDEEILRAIALHTTGGRDMTVLDKIIYISDMTEPSRDYPGVEELRSAAENGLDRAMLLSLRRTLEFNLAKNKIIHPDTITAYNSVLKDHNFRSKIYF